MGKKIIVGIDISDLKLSATGQKTVLAEIYLQLKKYEESETLRNKHLSNFELIYFASPFPIIKSRFKIALLFHHFLFHVWKQILLPLKAYSKNCDIVFCNDYFVPYFHLGFKSVQFFYDAFFFENPEHYNKFWFVLHKHLAMPAARKSKFILTITNHSLHKINLLAGIPLEKLICIYLAPKSLDQVGASENDPLLSQFIHTNYILHVGVMEKRKNVLKLIEAFYLLIKQGGIYADFKLVLGGTGTGRAESDDTNNILLLIQQLNLQEKVILTGFLTDQQLKTAYEKAYMYVFPSLNEGFGIPVLEAFKANIPVIVANNSCLPEVGGEAVMSFSPYDANELLDKMKLLIDNPALRLEFIKKGQTRLAYFSWEKATNELLAVFERAAQ